ncbi:ABC transporter ATP-binding protein [Arenimonas maotaiensis]|uniref:ABC transporter ATP-binding protein n=1 Tax=Arenimonas maotaiensis TaxID=1446479 RepID=A0A917CCA6_9GAMM|nr:ABC transporter ATP-binding protein [Arenimonas maotaiensis]GGF83810.1 ABC transporter ATP-binding protein [Arenimonas maotaiensis]
MIQAQGLCKAFAAIQAVDGFTLQVERGEIVALLGPNGAGKTTAMRMLAGFLRPDAGQAAIAGFDSMRQGLDARRRLGYLPEHAPIYREDTVLDYLRFVARARGLPRAEAVQALEAVFAGLSLNAIAYQPVATLSKGSARRVALAAAVMHRPPVLLLDEPTDGLDPIQKQQVRAMILELSKQSAVLMSTHQIDEVLSLCPRTVIMAGGRIRLDRTTDELLQQSRYHNAVSFVAQESIAARAALEGLSGVSGFEQNAVDGRLYVFVQGSKPQNQLIAERLAHRQVPYQDMRLEYGRLDEVFAKTVAEARA